jgi:hypothetical protein
VTNVTNVKILIKRIIEFGEGTKGLINCDPVFSTQYFCKPTTALKKVLIRTFKKPNSAMF